MPTYRYRANDRSDRPVTGRLEAASVSEAAAKLESEGLSLVTIALASPETTEPTSALAAAVQRLHSSRAQLIDPLVAYMAELPHGRRRREMHGVVNALKQEEAGASLAAAAEHPIVWAPLIAAAATDPNEPDGAPGVLVRFIERDRREQLLHRRRLLSLIYPVFLALLLLLIMWPIAALITPTFQAIYNDFGLDLPGLTIALLALGNFLLHGGGVLCLLLVGMVLVGLLTWPRWGPWLLDKAGLDFGGWRRRQGVVSASQFTRYAADFLEAGLPTHEAIRLADGSADGVAIRPAGSYALRGEIPAVARAALLRDLSACYADRSAKRASWITGAVGPLAIVLIGVAIGFTVIALFLPLVRLVEGLT